MLIYGSSSKLHFYSSIMYDRKIGGSSLASYILIVLFCFKPCLCDAININNSSLCLFKIAIGNNYNFYFFFFFHSNAIKYSIESYILCRWLDSLMGSSMVWINQIHYQLLTTANLWIFLILHVLHKIFGISRAKWF